MLFQTLFDAAFGFLHARLEVASTLGSDARSNSALSPSIWDFWFGNFWIGPHQAHVLLSMTLLFSLSWPHGR